MGLTLEQVSILELSNGYIALIDSNDVEKVSKYTWCTIKQGNSQVRVMTKDTNGKTLYLHRFILNYNKDKHIDHINGHSLDNRKCNLRICESQQNSFNSRKPRTNTSGYKGVSFLKDRKKFRAYIVKDSKQYYLGDYINKEDAALAYNTKAKELYGEYARLNHVRS